jgi:hypothetical protein
MRFGRQKARLWGAAVFVCCATGAFADDSFTLTGVNGNSLGGVYTSPYVATISGVGSGINVVCDDYLDEVYFNETWNVAVTNLGDALTSTSTTGLGDANLKFDSSSPASAYQQDLGYLTVSILTAQLLSNPTIPSTPLGADLSYAIWDVFDPGASTGIDANASTLAANAASLAANYLSQAGTVAGALALDNISAVTIYTANPDGPGAVNQQTCPGCGTPQEFVTVSMPEPSSPLLLGLDLLGVAGLIIFARRRLSRSLGSNQS